MRPIYQSLLAFYPCDDPQFCHNLFMKRGNTRFQQQIYSRNYFVTTIPRKWCRDCPRKTGTWPRDCSVDLPSGRIEGSLCPTCVNISKLSMSNICLLRSCRYQKYSTLNCQIVMFASSPDSFEDCNGLVMAESMEGLPVHRQNLVSCKNTFTLLSSFESKLPHTFYKIKYDLTLI